MIFQYVSDLQVRNFVDVERWSKAKYQMILKRTGTSMLNLFSRKTFLEKCLLMILQNVLKLATLMLKPF